MPSRGVDNNDNALPNFGGFPFGAPPNGNSQGPHGSGRPNAGPWGGPGGAGWEAFFTGGPGADSNADFPWGRHGHGHGRGGHRGRGGGPGRGGRGGFFSFGAHGNEEDPIIVDTDNTNANNDNEPASDEKREKSETIRADVPDPEEVVPEDAGPYETGYPGHPHPWGHHGRRGSGHRGSGRGHGCGGRRGGPFGPHHGHDGPHHGHGPAPPFDGPQAGFGDLLRSAAGHPFFQNLRNNIAAQVANNNGIRNVDESNNDNNNNNSASGFTPPVDLFTTDRAYVLHVALPGAKKEDIGVNWDPERGVLNIAGVVHRPGDEEFLSTLTSGERKIGLFERSIKLPPVGTSEKDEVDGLSISAKMEDGVLIVTVPKIEKEWTEIHKVDIQ